MGGVNAGNAGPVFFVLVHVFAVFAFTLLLSVANCEKAGVVISTANSVSELNEIFRGEKFVILFMLSALAQSHRPPDQSIGELLMPAEY